MKPKLINHLANAFAIVVILAPYHAIDSVCRAARWATPRVGRWLDNRAVPAFLSAAVVVVMAILDAIQWLGERGRDTPALVRNIGVGAKRGTVAVVQGTVAVAVLAWAVVSNPNLLGW